MTYSELFIIEKQQTVKLQLSPRSVLVIIQ